MLSRFPSSLLRGVSGDDPAGGAGSGVPRRRRETAAPGGPGSRRPGLRGLAPTHRWRLRCPTAGGGSVGPRPKIATVERREGSRSHRDRSAPRKRGRRASQARRRRNECACRRSTRPSSGAGPAAVATAMGSARRSVSQAGGEAATSEGTKDKRQGNNPGAEYAPRERGVLRGTGREAGCLTS